MPLIEMSALNLCVGGLLDAPFSRSMASKKLYTSTSRRFEFRHRYALRYIVEDHLHRHFADDVLRLSADNVGQQPRPFFEFDQGNDIGDFRRESRMIDAVESDEAEHLAAAGHRHEGKIGGETMRTGLRRRKPVLAAGIAARNFQAMPLRRLPKRHRLRRRLRDRLLLRRSLYLFRGLAHYAFPRIRVEWQT